MRVRDCMTSPVEIIGPDAPAWEALGLMRRLRIRRLPVQDGGTLVGIVTWTDLVRVQPPAVGDPGQIPTLAVGVQVRHLMTSSPRTVGPDDTLEEAADLMRKQKIGGLPVLEDGRLVGIITESDLFDALAEIRALRPHEARIHVAVGSIAAELPRIVAGLSRSGIPVCALWTVRLRGIETVDLVVHARDSDRARAVLQRLALRPVLLAAPTTTGR